MPPTRVERLARARKEVDEAMDAYQAAVGKLDAHTELMDVALAPWRRDSLHLSQLKDHAKQKLADALRRLEAA
jgi:hypothetical protein